MRINEYGITYLLQEFGIVSRGPFKPFTKINWTTEAKLGMVKNNDLYNIVFHEHCRFMFAISEYLDFEEVTKKIERWKAK